MLVKERMTSHPLVVEPNMPITDAQRYMKDNNIRHLPVVSKGKLVGLITRETLLQALPSPVTTLSVWEMNYLLGKVKVGDVMVGDVVTVEEDVPIEEAARMLIENKIGCLLVMRNGMLVGIITDIDLMCTMLEMLGGRRAGLRVTLAAPDEVGELAKVTATVADQGGCILACGTYPAADPAKWGIVLKVMYADKDKLLAAFEQLEGVEILDVRET
jgi:acetoin utilization protein AcuB